MAYFDRYITDPWGKPYQSIHETSAIQKFRVGTRYEEPGPLGRVFHYAKNGAVALVAGNIVSSAALGGALTTIQSDCPVKVAANIGDTKVYIWALTTEQTADLYAEGTAVINTHASLAFRTFAIKSNTLLLIAGATTGYIELYDPLPVALLVTDLVTLATNPYMNVITHPAVTPVGMPLGVPIVDVPIGDWFWCQTWGPAGVKSITLAGVVGVDACVGVTVAGEVTPYLADGTTLERVGQYLMIGTILQSNITYLQLAA